MKILCFAFNRRIKRCSSRNFQAKTQTFIVNFFIFIQKLKIKNLRLNTDFQQQQPAIASCLLFQNSKIN